ncbi:nucleotidyltransferase domain-containing protein [Paenibacillus sp. BAC0078]
MLPQVVERTMNTLCDSLSVNNSNIISVYIYGSVALGDYIEGSSDIDFIAILCEPLNMSDIQAISAAHKEVENEFPQADINPITWWILKNHGIKVYGSEQSFNYEIEIKSLLGYVIDNLNYYWVTWIERLEKQLTLKSLSDQDSVTKQLDESVEWCTLGMLRQLYTIKEHKIKSKVEAGYYGITTVPQQWHRLIYEAINIKRLRPERYYCSNEKRLTDLVALLRYIHLEANRVFDDSNGWLNK